MNAWRIYRQGLVVGWGDFKIFWSLKTWFSCWMLKVLTHAYAWVLLGKMLGSESRLKFLLVGNAAVVGAAAAIWASNACTWARYDGTHPLVVISPSSMVPAIVGRTSVWLFNGIATSLTTFCLFLLSFGLFPLSLRLLLGLAVAVSIVCLSAFCFALLLGAIVGHHTKLRNLVLDITGSLFMAWCGVSVPVEFWPRPIQWLAQILPLTHGLSSIRQWLEGGTYQDIWRGLALEILVGAGWLALALLLMDRMAEAGRVDGSIEQS